MKCNKTYYTSLLQQLYRSCKGIGVFFCFLFLNFHTVQANEYFKEIPLEPINTFDEVPVEIIVKGYLRFEADVIITDTHAVYVNVEELFKKLGILCITEDNGNILKGFIENESIRYLIDFEAKQINRGDRTIKSINGIVKELGSIYVETSIMNEAFGLNMLFNFRSLSIKLEADFELPLVKQARLEKMRQNVSKLQSKNEIVIDTVLGRDYHHFNGGALDWSFSASQQEGGNTNNRFSLGLGSELLFGEAKVAFNYYDQTKFDRRQLYYNWRWVNNENKYIKQAQVGKIGSQSIAFLGAPLVGASFNNSPNTVRKATGTYTISEYTEPNWTVELYINDNLVDYTEADASGLYEFKVPIVYGYTTLKLKFFGPLGEERIEEKIMNTPYTLMPSKVLEYNVSGGILEDDDGSTFGRGEFNYGVNRFVTIGGGVEYLSNIIDEPLIPFANISFQPFSKLMINMEYAHNVSLKGLLNYNLGRSAFLEVDYSKYVEGQQATLNNTNEERKIRLSLPFKIKKISVNSKLSFNQYVYDAFNFNQLDALFSGRYKNFSANASVASNWINERDPFLTSTFVFSRRMRNGLILRPSFQYNITDGNMMRYRAEIEKRVSKMSFSASYERNVQYASDNVFLSFRYDLPFARAGITSSYSNDRFNFSENAQGSLAFGGDNGYVHAGNNAALGKGGILLYPFLDLNQNGIRDKGEKLVFIPRVKVTGGKAITSEKDSIIRVSNLNAFINYNVTFYDDDLDNISWRFKHKTYQILVDPNQYKKVEVPILVMGEVSGMVHFNNNTSSKGLGRITVQITDIKGNKVAETLSERDGYFSYLGLKPGVYNIKVDEAQLEKLGYQSSPKTQTFTIKESNEGTIVDDISFVLKTTKVTATTTVNAKATIKVTETAKETAVEPPIVNDEVKENNKQLIEAVKETVVAPTIVNDEENKVQPKETVIEKTKEVITEDENVDPSFGKISDVNGFFYTIQLGVYKEHKTKKELYNLPNIYYETLPSGTIRYVYGTFNDKHEATNAKNGIIFRGVKGAFVITYNNGEIISPVDLKNKEQLPLTKKQRFSWFVDKNVNTNFSPTFNIKELFYTVQIGAYKNYVTAKQLQYLSPIFYDLLANGNVRYVYGKFNTKKEAKVAEKSVVNKGLNDAYVVAYNNGEQVNAYSLKKVKVTDSGNSEVYGKVQYINQGKKEGLKNVDLILLNSNGFMVSITSTDDTGAYYFANLIPGDYTIKIDSNKLEEFNYVAVPIIQNINIQDSKEIGTVKGLDFILTKIKK